MKITGEVIQTIKKQYRERTNDLLKEYLPQKGDIASLCALSNILELESGIYLLNILEKILDGDEKTIKRWGLKNSQDKHCLAPVEGYEIGNYGEIYFNSGQDTWWMSNELINDVIDRLDTLGFIDDKSLPLIVDYKINDTAEIVVNTTLGIFHISPRMFEKMVKEAMDEKYLKISLLFVRNSKGGWVNKCDVKMKPKTEEEMED